MDNVMIAEIQEEVNRGFEALQRHKADQAAVFFIRALIRAEDLEDNCTRRDEFSGLSSAFEKCGFPDLALMAAEDAVDIDIELGMTDLMVSDIIAVGNAHLKMDNTAQSEKCYREALQISLEQGNFANAASANTNLASIIANRGDIPGAIALLENSLEYLAKQPFDPTEIQTRFALLQALEFEEHDVDEAIKNARQLCSRFFEKIPDIQLDVMKDFVGRAANRYLKAHPEVDASTWKAENFPMFHI